MLPLYHLNIISWRLSHLSVQNSWCISLKQRVSFEGHAMFTLYLPCLTTLLGNEWANEGLMKIFFIIPSWPSLGNSFHVSGEGRTLGMLFGSYTFADHFWQASNLQSQAKHNLLSQFFFKPSAFSIDPTFSFFFFLTCLIPLFQILSNLVSYTTTCPLTFVFIDAKRLVKWSCDLTLLILEWNYQRPHS